MFLLFALRFFNLGSAWSAGRFLDEFAAGGNTVEIKSVILKCILRIISVAYLPPSLPILTAESGLLLSSIVVATSENER